MESNSFYDLKALVLKQEKIEQWSTEQRLDSACRINDKELLELLERGDAREDAKVTDNVVYGGRDRECRAGERGSVGDGGGDDK